MSHGETSSPVVAARRTRLLRRRPERAARPTLRLTRRGRLLLIGLPVLLGAVAVLAGALLLVLSPQAQAGDAASVEASKQAENVASKA